MKKELVQLYKNATEIGDKLKPSGMGSQPERVELYVRGEEIEIEVVYEEAMGCGCCARAEYSVYITGEELENVKSTIKKRLDERKKKKEKDKAEKEKAQKRKEKEKITSEKKRLKELKDKYE